MRRKFGRIISDRLAKFLDAHFPEEKGSDEETEIPSGAAASSTGTAATSESAEKPKIEIKRDERSFRKIRRWLEAAIAEMDRVGLNAAGESDTTLIQEIIKLSDVSDFSFREAEDLIYDYVKYERTLPDYISWEVCEKFKSTRLACRLIETEKWPTNAQDFSSMRNIFKCNPDSFPEISFVSWSGVSKLLLPSSVEFLKYYIEIKKEALADKQKKDLFLMGLLNQLIESPVLKLYLDKMTDQINLIIELLKEVSDQDEKNTFIEKFFMRLSYLGFLEKDEVLFKSIEFLDSIEWGKKNENYQRLQAQFSRKMTWAQCIEVCKKTGHSRWAQNLIRYGNLPKDNELEGAIKILETVDPNAIFSLASQVRVDRDSWSLEFLKFIFKKIKSAENKTEKNRFIISFSPFSLKKDEDIKKMELILESNLYQFGLSDLERLYATLQVYSSPLLSKYFSWESCLASKESQTIASFLLKKTMTLDVTAIHRLFKQERSDLLAIVFEYNTKSNKELLFNLLKTLHFDHASELLRYLSPLNLDRRQLDKIANAFDPKEWSIDFMLVLGGAIQQKFGQKQAPTQTPAAQAANIQIGEPEAKEAKDTPGTAAALKPTSPEDSVMDDKLFGHIQNDHALKGTTLVGHEFIHTLQHLNKFIENIKTGKWMISGLEGERKQHYILDLVGIQEKMIRCLSIEKSIRAFEDYLVNYKAHCRSSEADSLSEGFYSEVNEPYEKREALIESWWDQLEENQELLLPGGWDGLNRTSGHAMLYEIKKVKDKYVFLIHNTGAGLRFHATKNTKRGDYYSSVKAFEIPITSYPMFKNNIKSLFKTLLAPRVMPALGKESYNEARLYTELTKQVGALGFKEIQSPNTHEWTMGQDSGTCSWQVLASYLKTYPFHPQVDYRDIRFEVIKGSLDEYYHLNKSRKRLNVGVVTRQLNFALQNFSVAIMEMKKSNPPLSDKRTEKGLLLIQTIQADLRQAQKPLSKPRTIHELELPQYRPTEQVTSAEEKKRQEEIRLSKEFDFEVKQFKLTHLEWTTKKQGSVCSPDYDIPIFNAENPLQSFRSVLEIVKKNKEAGHFGAVTRCIEAFYLKVPIPMDKVILDKLSKDQQAESIEILKQLNSFYGVSCAKQSLGPFAERAITFWNGQALAINIAAHYFQGSSDNNAEVLNALYVATLKDVNAQFLMGSPYFITGDLKFQEQHKKIQQFFDTFRKVTSDKNRYKEIIKRHEAALVAAAKQDPLFTHNAKFTGKVVPDEEIAIWYYCSKEPLDPKLIDPKIIDLIKQEMSIVTNITKMRVESAVVTKDELSQFNAMDPYKTALSAFRDDMTYRLDIHEVSGLWSSTLEWFDHPQGLTHDWIVAQATQSTIPDSSLMAKAFSKRESSNEIQIHHTTGNLTESVAFQRSLMATRITPQTQVTATVDLLKKEITRAEDPDFQVFAFINLFESDLLNARLLKTPNVASELLDVIQRGVELYANPPIAKPAAFFFFKTGLFLQRILNEMPDKKELSELKEIRKKLSLLTQTNLTKLIPAYESKLKDKDLSVITTLRQLYTLNLLRIYHNASTLDYKMDNDEFESILTAVFFRKNNAPILFDDPFLEHHADKAIVDLGPKLNQYLSRLQKENNKTFQETLNKIAKNLDKPVPETALWTGEYPEYKLGIPGDPNELLTLNVLTGQVFQNESKVVPLPKDIYDHVLYKEFFKTSNVLAKQSVDQNTYEFIIESVCYRFRLDPIDRTAVLEREITIDGKKEWYQHVPKLDVKTYKNYDSIPFPNILLDSDHKIWTCSQNASVQKTVILKDPDQVPVCYVDTVDQKIVKLDKAGNKTDRLLLNPKASAFFLAQYPFLTQFEDAELMQFWRDTKTGEYEVEFPRYNLNFKKCKQSDGKQEWVWQNDPRYRIKTDSPYSVIQNFKAPLLLTARVEGTVPDTVLIPKQQMLALAKFSGSENLLENEEYYQLHLNTQGVLVSDPKSSPFVQWRQYTNQEQVAQYQVQSSLELIPKTREDAFYLAYLYLASRQPYLSLITLQKALQNRAPMNEAEIEWLRRIMLEIPAKVAEGINDKIQEEKARINTPEFAAIRMLAGLSLTEQKIKGLKLELPNRDLKESKIVDIKCKGLDRKKTIDFFNNDTNFYATMLETYKTYRRKIKNIPGKLRLGEDQELLLLRQLRKHSKNALITNRLSVLTNVRLQRHKKALEELQREKPQQYGTYFQQRYKKISDRLSKQPNIKTSQKIMVEIKVKIETNFKNIHKEEYAFKDDVLSSILYSIDSEGREHTGVAASRFRFDRREFVTPENFSIATAPENFAYSFLRYYNLALNATQENKAAWLALKAQVETRLRELVAKERLIDQNTAKGDLGKRRSLAEELIVILGYALQYPEQFKKLKVFTKTDMDQSIAVIRSLNSAGRYLETTLVEPKEEAIEIPRTPLRALPEASKPLILEPTSDTTQLITHAFQAVANEKALFKAKLEQSIDKAEAKESLEWLEVQRNQEAITQMLYAEIKDDYPEGIKRNRLLQARNKAMEALYASNAIPLDKLAARLMPLAEKDDSKEHYKILENQKNDIMRLANLPPQDPQKRLIWDLEKGAQQRNDLTFQEILRLFLSQDLTVYRQKTSLSDAQIQALHQKIFHYLLQATDIQYYDRLQNEIAKLKNERLTKEQKESILNEIGTILNSQRCFDPIKNPNILLYEYLDDKLLHPEQFTYLKSLLTSSAEGFDNLVVQLIMGGGKSKVLLPLLALGKATGTNLSIIEVPEAIFDINQADLIKSTEKLFGQKGRTFKFDHTVDCTVEYLENLKWQWKSIIGRREYLITTKESLQALELKWIRLINSLDPTKPNPEMAKKIKLLTDIICILKFQGDVIIDEVDSTLDIRKQLIDTVGANQTVSIEEAKHLLKLFQFLDKVKSDPEDVSLGDIAKGTRTLSKEALKKLIESLADNSVKHPESPLHSLLSDFNDAQKEELILYLKDKGRKAPDSILKFSDKNKDLIALYRQEITTILPLTLNKSINEYFGLTKDVTKKGIEHEVAIPYLGSDAPNETAKIGNYLEAGNYTLQIQLYKPLSEQTTEIFLRKFKNQDAFELMHGKSRGETQTAKEQFKKLTGFNLDDFDLSNSDHIKRFHQSVLQNETFKEYCLTHLILNAVDKNNCILASNAQNHTSQFRSVQGLTGMDWNHHCRAKKIKRKREVSVGTDGQTLHNLLRDPQPVHLLGAKEVKAGAKDPEDPKDPKDAKKLDYLSLFLTHPKPEILHAWIDIGAYFKGTDNADVAKQFSSLFAAHPKKFGKLKYVLYFGADNLLRALPVSADPSKVEPIILENTDPKYIQSMLKDEGGNGIDASQYFTYYDQRRTTGTDIVQASDAHAFVSLGPKTLLRDWLQGVMRMRKLGGFQRTEAVILKSVQEAYPEIKKWDEKSIIKLVIDNQVIRLADDHFRAAVQKMKNVLREDLKVRLLKEPDPYQQKAKLKAFETAFFAFANQTPFQAFGGVIEKEDIEKVLSTLEKDILTQWNDMLKKADIKPNKTEEDDMQSELKDIIQSSKNICLSKVDKLKAFADGSGVLDDTEVEIDTETETDLELATQYAFVKGASACPVDKLTDINFDQWETEKNASFGGILLESLEENVASTKIPKAWNFSNNLFVSKHFAKTSTLDPSLIGPYTKDNIFFLMEQDSEKETLKCVLVTPEEAEHMETYLSKAGRKNKRFWIETVHQTVMAGQKPEEKDLHPDYKRTLEQIAFFNGDADVLYQSLNESSWLKENTAEKLNYFEVNLMPLHKDKVNLFSRLSRKAQEIFGEQDASLLRFSSRKQAPKKQGPGGSLPLKP